jgi:hypothetical protein
MIFLKTIQTKKNMNKIFIASSALTLAVAQIAITATTSLAAIPQLNYTCPGKIEVHADQGGPVYINGKEAKLKVFNQNYYEAETTGFAQKQKRHQVIQVPIPVAPILVPVKPNLRA